MIDEEKKRLEKTMEKQWQMIEEEKKIFQLEKTTVKQELKVKLENFQKEKEKWDDVKNKEKDRIEEGQKDLELQIKNFAKEKEEWRKKIQKKDVVQSDKEQSLDNGNKDSE